MYSDKIKKVLQMRKLIPSVITVLFLFTLTSCKGTDIFGDYSLTYSYSSQCSETSDGAKAESTLSIMADSSVFAETTNELKSDDSTVELIMFTDKVNQGGLAKVTIKGKKDTVYSIKLFLSSGLSKSASLRDKTSDSDGTVSWTWRISANISNGDYPILIEENNKTVLQTRITVVSSED